MTGQKTLDLLMSRLGNRTESELRNTCLSEMELVQSTKLEQGPIKPWFLITEATDAVLTPNERRLQVPDDFLSELEEEGSLYIIDENGKEHELIKKAWDENVSWHGLDATSDLPKNYSLVGGYFMIFPIPLQARTVRMRYYASQPAPQDNNNENVWLKHASDLLIAETGLVMAGQHVQLDPDKVQRFQEMIGPAWDRINRENVSRAEANIDRRMG